MAKVTDLEDWKSVKIALKILVIVKSIYEQIMVLCETLRTESSFFLTDEMEELIELAYEHLGIKNSDAVQTLLYDYLLDDLSLEEFLAAVKNKKDDSQSEP